MRCQSTLRPSNTYLFEQCSLVALFLSCILHEFLISGTFQGALNAFQMIRLQIHFGRSERQVSQSECYQAWIECTSFILKFFSLRFIFGNHNISERDLLIFGGFPLKSNQHGWAGLTNHNFK